MVARHVCVVLVHGIGESKHGETLTHWGADIEELLAEQLQLKRSAIALHETPATIALQNAKSATRVTLVESWWSELFQPPSFLAFASWTVRSVPTALLSHLDHRLRRVTNHLEAAFPHAVDSLHTPSNPNKDDGAIVGGLLPVLGLLIELFVLLLGFLLIAFLPPVMLLLILMSLVPQFRGVAQAIQNVLTRNAGDSLVFSTPGLLRDAIVNKVKSDIRWAVSKSDRCIVLAHSQGAAVTHRAIRELDKAGLPCPDVFVSFGSGLRKLTELETIEHAWLAWTPVFAGAGATIAVSAASWSAPLPFAAALGTTAYAIALCLAGMAIRMLLHVGLVRGLKRKNSRCLSRVANWGGLAFIVGLAGIVAGAPSVLFVSAVALGLAFTLVMEWRHKTHRATHRADQQALERARWKTQFEIPSVWLDFYGSADPVSSGPLMDRHTARTYRPWPLVNIPWRAIDHEAAGYFANERFRRALGRIVETALTVDALAPAKESARPPLYMTKFYEIFYRLLLLGSGAAWAHVGFDRGVARTIRSFAPIADFLKGCSSISVDGKTVRVCDPNMLQTGLYYALPALLVLVAVLLTSYALRLLFALGGRCTLPDSSHELASLDEWLRSTR